MVVIKFWNLNILTVSCTIEQKKKIDRIQFMFRTPTIHTCVPFTYIYY